VALVAVQTWSSGDKITVSSDPETTLDNFLDYRKNTLLSLYSHDIAELLTLVDNNLTNFTSIYSLGVYTVQKY
jgi:Cu2+-containing amine oxidase